jgi:hypothetical protein
MTETKVLRERGCTARSVMLISRVRAEHRRDLLIDTVEGFRARNCAAGLRGQVESEHGRRLGHTVAPIRPAAFDFAQARQAGRIGPIRRAPVRP